MDNWKELRKRLKQTKIWGWANDEVSLSRGQSKECEDEIIELFDQHLAFLKEKIEGMKSNLSKPNAIDFIWDAALDTVLKLFEKVKKGKK